MISRARRLERGLGATSAGHLHRLQACCKRRIKASERSRGGDRQSNKDITDPDSRASADRDLQSDTRDVHVQRFIVQQDQ